MPFGFHSKSLIETALSAHLGDVTDVTGIFLGDGAVISAALANVDFVPVSGISVATFANAGYLGSTVTSGNTFSLRGYTGAAYSALLTITNAATPTIAIPQLTGNTTIGTSTTGANLTINGTLTETITQPMVTGGWTLGFDTGGWTITTGTLSKSASTGTLTATAVSGQSTVTAGRTYKIVLNVSAFGGSGSGATAYFGIGGSSTYLITGTGAITTSLTAATSGKFTVSAVSTRTLSIDSLSISEITVETGDVTILGRLYSEGRILAGLSAGVSPVYTFADALTTGIGYNVSATTLTFWVAGNDRLYLISTVGTQVLGSLGVNAAPSATTGRFILADTSYAGSGSLTGAAILMTQTWNTTGVVIGIKYTITDIASNAASMAMQIFGGNAGTTNLISVSKTGAVVIPDTMTSAGYLVGATAGIDTTITTAGLVGKTITVTKGIITGFA